MDELEHCRGGRVMDIQREQLEQLGFSLPDRVTNYDRIISKTPEELAEWIAGSVLNLTGGSLKMATEAWADWLKQEVGND